MVQICLVDLNDAGEFFRIGVETDADANAVVSYWRRYSSDVRYSERRKQGRYDTGKRACELGTIVCCRQVGGVIARREAAAQASPASPEKGGARS